MNEGKHLKELRAGIFLLVTLVLLLLSVLFIGSKTGILTPQVGVLAQFEDVSGLVTGAPVMLQGIVIGSVTGINIEESKEGSVLIVRMDIATKYLKYVRKDSIASIQTMGLLGDKYVNIAMGSIKRAVHKEGDKIASINPPDMYKAIERGSKILNNLQEASNSLKIILSDISENIQVASFTLAVDELRQLVRDIRTTEGSLHRLIYDDTIANVSENIERITKNIAIASDQFTSKNNLIYSLLYDKKGGEVVDNLETITKKLSSILSQAGKEGTFVNALLASDGDGEKIMDNLSIATGYIKHVAKNLDVTLNALAKGEGSLGALIRDPSLYNNLVVILDGAKRSFIIKKAIEYSIRKSFKTEQ